MIAYLWVKVSGEVLESVVAAVPRRASTTLQGVFATSVKRLAAEGAKGRKAAAEDWDRNEFFRPDASLCKRVSRAQTSPCAFRR